MMLDGLLTLLTRSVAPRKRRRRPDWPSRFGYRVPVGAAVLIRDATGRILLVRQTYQRPSIWLPPGGWVDRGETPQQAACREAREEVGLNVAVGRPLAVRNGGYGELTLLFDCKLLDDRAPRLSDEIAEAQFFAPDALPPLTPTIDLWLGEALTALRIATSDLALAT